MSGKTAHEEHMYSEGPGDLDPGVAGGGAVMRDGQGAICCHNTAPCNMQDVTCPAALSKQPSIDSLIQFYIMINLVTIKLSISPVMSVSVMTFRSWSWHWAPHAALVPR